MQYKVGDVIRHKRYHYRGVIYGWDAECKAEEDWMLQMRIDQLPGELLHLSHSQPGHSSCHGGPAMSDVFTALQQPPGVSVGTILEVCTLTLVGTM